jgi:hypothetical protein
MSILRDLAVEFINAAKNSKDAKTKLIQLEQVKEIVLHRQRELLPVLISDVLDLMTDRAALIRKFLIKLASETFLQEPVVVLPKMLELFSFVMTDSNDSVLSTVARELSRIYGKVVLQIVSIPESNGQEALHLWKSLKALTHKFSEHLASARSDSLKQNCLNLLEETIVFAIPNVTVTADPRLARRDPRLGRTIKSDAQPALTQNTAECISLHHTIVSRTALQKEAEEQVLKVVQWLAKGGPANYPFSPSVLSAAAQLLASVGTVRTTAYATVAAKALSLLIVEKHTLVLAMPSLDLEYMARAATRLLKAAVHSADPEGQLQKLKAAVNSLNLTSALTTATTATENDSTSTTTTGAAGTAVGTTTRKRAAEEMDDDEGLDVDSDAFRQSILQSLNTAESTRREAMQRSAAAAQSLFQVNPATTSSASSSAASAAAASAETVAAQDTVVCGEYSELCGDILSVDSAALRFDATLATIQPTPAEDDVCCAPQAPSESRQYSDLAVFSLLKLLENYPAMMTLGTHVRRNLLLLSDLLWIELY